MDLHFQDIAPNTVVIVLLLASMAGTSVMRSHNPGCKHMQCQECISTLSVHAASLGVEMLGVQFSGLGMLEIVPGTLK